MEYFVNRHLDLASLSGKDCASDGFEQVDKNKHVSGSWRLTVCRLPLASAFPRNILLQLSTDAEDVELIDPSL